MKKKRIWGILWIIFLLGIFHTNVYAVNLEKNDSREIEKIENMVITVEPRMKDGSLDVQYEITWKVLRDLLDKPLTRVYIGAPGRHFNQVTALSDNIEKISADAQRARVKIDFKSGYQAGESVTFKYSLHQKFIGLIAKDIFRFEFASPLLSTPIDHLTIKWKADEVEESDCHSQEGNYLIWHKENLAKEERVIANVRYDKSTFSHALSANYVRDFKWGSRRNRWKWYLVAILISFFICFVFWHMITKM